MTNETDRILVDAVLWWKALETEEVPDWVHDAAEILRYRDLEHSPDSKGNLG